jgi:hypothetical protein
MSVLDYLNKDVSKHDKDLESSKAACPSCQSTKIRTRSTHRSVVIAGAATLILIGLPFIFMADQEVYRLALFFLLGALFSFAATVASATSAIFGKHVCRQCGHRWR